ncbi:hypothetical protein Poli38472_007838 [Pythium oligandrum]|uniref:RecF/RecN/SMC N-terminal domain-containing protein n=1 Tax=Pythium oligandrum TaxID=41045 RepID=A0A8K1CQV8_PYTOL|nr:hypothetical protein Poli38472_007838 [Pythium oligandrum]|eukprot:TMW68166.1 hypothetical protein Poli38472_007838 [Pythium oligandrum]
MLERMEMENFKSFGGRHEVRFAMGLNCITGPNGAGKSNVLEAICFAFGESSCAKLRVKTMKELHSKTTAGEQSKTSTTRVTLHLRTRQKTALVLCATLCMRTGHRTYKLNNRVTPIKHVKRQLRLQCGINVDISLWLIQQNLVHKMASKTPAEIAAYLCEAGGTKLFLEYRDEARASIEKFKASGHKIRFNIKNLSDVVSQEVAILDDYQAKRENERLIKRCEEEVEGLKKELLISRLQYTQAQAKMAEEEERNKASMLSDIVSHLSQCTHEIERVQVALEKAQNFQTRNDEVQHLCYQKTSELADLEARIHHLRQTALDIEKELRSQEHELAEVSTEKQLLEQAVTEITAHKRSVAIIDDVLIEHGQCNDPKGQVVLKLTDAMNQIRTDESSTSFPFLRMNLSAKERMLEYLQQRETELLSSLSELIRKSEFAAKEIEYLRVLCQNYHPGRMEQREAELKDMISRCEEGVRRLNSRMPTLNPPVQGEGDFGLLADLISLQSQEDDDQAWIKCLGLLLDKFLSCRLCADTEMAKRILQANANKHSFTMWPTQTLRIPPRKFDRMFEAILMQYGRNNVRDPLELVVPLDESRQLYHAAKLGLRKAVGSWLLVRTDEIGQDILRRHGVSSVSMTLNLHSPGLLSGGSGKRDSTFSCLVKRHEERRNLSRLQSDLANVRDSIAAINQLSQLEADRIRLDQNRESVRDELAYVKDQLAQAEEEHTMLERASRNSRDSENQKNIVLADLTRFLAIVQESPHHPASSALCGRSSKQLEDELATSKSKLNDAENKTSTLRHTIAHLSEDLRITLDECNKQQTLLEELQLQLRASEENLSELNEESQRIEAQKTLLSELEDKKRAFVQAKKQVDRELKLVEVEQVKLRKEASAISAALRESLGDAEFAVMTVHRAVSDIEKDIKLAIQRAADLRVAKRVLDEKLRHVPLVDEESIMGKKSSLQRFQAFATNITEAISNLEDGIKSTQSRTKKANEVAHLQVGSELQQIFSRAVPSKSVDLLPVEENIEAGLVFDVRSAGNGMHVQKSTPATKELSGGQLTMLGMAYVFALARYSASPLYILDEIDAALDEHNQRLVVELVLEYFSHSQVICISHHEAFHARAHQLIQVEKSGSHSRVSVRVQRG